MNQTLTELISQFAYTHMPRSPIVKQLLTLIADAESQYIKKIKELELRITTLESGKKQDEESFNRGYDF